MIKAEKIRTGTREAMTQKSLRRMARSKTSNMEQHLRVFKRAGHEAQGPGKRGGGENCMNNY